MCSIGNVGRENKGIELEKNQKGENGRHIRGQILWLLGVHEGLLQFNSHALLRLRSAPWAETLAIARDSCDWLCLDVTADAEGSDSVQVP